MARQHIVKCPYCKKTFDAQPDGENKIWIKVGARRYAHLQCVKEHDKNLTQEERDYEDFFKYCKELFKEDYNYILTKKLAERYAKENGYTYSGMKKALQWFYEIEGNSIENANGSIGILPYCFNDAKDYYYKLYIAQEKNKGIKEWRAPVREIFISVRDPWKQPPRLIDLDTIDLEETNE